MKLWKIFPRKFSLSFCFQLGPGNGPKCVFLTSSSRKVTEIEMMLSSLKGFCKILKAYGGGLEFEIKVSNKIIVIQF